MHRIANGYDQATPPATELLFHLSQKPRRPPPMMTEIHSPIVTDENLVVLVKKNLKASGGLDLWMANLSQRLNLISNNPDSVIRNVLVENWADEVIRFIILKNALEDFTEPCQLSPGYAISVGWSALVILPNVYEMACQTIGSEGKFEHDFSKNGQAITTDPVKRKLLIQRHNATLREYEKYFDSKPPMLYWNLDPVQYKTAPPSDDLTSLFEMFCCGNLESTPSFEHPKVPLFS